MTAALASFRVRRRLSRRFGRAAERDRAPSPGSAGITPALIVFERRLQMPRSREAMRDAMSGCNSASRDRRSSTCTMP